MKNENDLRFERICALRNNNPTAHYLIRIGMKFSEFMSVAKSDRKKSGRLSENTLDKQKDLKAYRKMCLELNRVSFDELRAYERANNYSFNI